MTDNSRMVVVSNRLPISLTKKEDGTWDPSPSAGGLVTAVSPVLRDRGGLWIGWTGTTKEDLDLKVLKRVLGPVSKEMGYRLIPILLNREEINKYYYGFSNEVIWPLFHDLQTMCYFDPSYADAYQEVNRTFAKVVASHTREEDFLWVHDYHLIPLARVLKERGEKRNCFFFLHITFPPRDILMKLPWREQLLRDMMEFEMIGFQSLRDRRNFVDCLRVFDPNTKVTGKGPVLEMVSAFGRTTKAAGLPISIDFKDFEQLASSEKTKESVRDIKERTEGTKIILGVDRLDYTKGIPEKLQAFRTALQYYPELREKVTLLPLLVPSRDDVPAYKKLKGDIERLVSQLNGDYSIHGWTPVQYIHRSVPREELVAMYRAADICLVTSLKDGMNLVAKEYCASQVENTGVLILSEFAGAAIQLGRGAVLINPHDREGTADAIHRAVNMSEEECIERMAFMRRSIRKRDVFWWVNNFLRVAMNRRLKDFPEREIAPFRPHRYNVSQYRRDDNKDR